MAGHDRRKKRRAGRRMPLLTVLMAVSLLCSGLTAGARESCMAEAERGRDSAALQERQPQVAQGKAIPGTQPDAQPQPGQKQELPDGGLPADGLPETQPDEQLPVFVQVEQEYFDDALFIGDSRVVGVELYAGWDNMTYCAEKGMTVYNMFDRKAAGKDGEKITLCELLQERSFGKIYLEIGINEMGKGTVDSFMEAYEEAVGRLREMQPDALIFLCGIMYVRQDRSESDPVFNNPGIRERNKRIAQLADGSSVFYLDINEDVADENGNLNPEYTWDAVHLLGKYDGLWMEYFCRHGIVRG